MKTLKNILFFVVLITAMQASAQTDKATTSKVLEAKTFIFNATTALPMASSDINKVLSSMAGGQAGTIELSGSQYQLIVTKDSIEANLPYYGRAYGANMNPGDSGIQFKTKNFSYTVDKKKKGNQLITIRPENAKDTQTLTLSISEDGSAMLNVISNNRQPISFNGYISEPKNKK